MSLIAYSVDKKISLKKCTWLMALLAVLSAFSFGVIYSSLTLFFNHALSESVQFSVSTYAVFATWMFSASILGGYWGGRFGHRNCSILGALLLILALLVIAVLHQPYWGLSLFILGTGFYIPNYTLVLGQIFKPGDGQRSYAYVLVYMGMNLGVFIGALFAGLVVQHIGFYAIFGAGALFLVLALCLFVYLYQRLPFRDGAYCQLQNKRGFQLAEALGTLITVLVALFPLYLLLHHPDASDAVALSLFILVFALLVFRSFISKSLTPNDCRRLRMYVILMLASFVFWALYNMEGSLLMAYFDHGIQRNIFGITLQTETLTIMNPTFNILIGLLMYFGFQKLPWRLGSDYKIYIGVTLMGIGFAIFAWSASAHLDAKGLVPIVWILFGFFFLCFAEILIAPLLYSMATEYGAPILQGILIGAAQLTIGSSAGLTDVLSRQVKIVPSDNPWMVNHLFAHAAANYAELALTIGIVFMLIGWLIRRRLGVQ